MGKKKILVCPLDWGLGHAARDVPIINRLLDLQHEVILAGDGPALDFLRVEFPGLVTLRFGSGIRIRYSKRLPAWINILMLSPFFLLGIFFEHFRIKRIIRQTKPDVLLSDNRYGLWNRRVKSILITHQIHLRLPRIIRFMEYPVHLMIKALITRFDRCWIPDYPGKDNLSGKLSHGYALPRNATFIGAISRFIRPDGKPESVPDSSRFKPVRLLILLSGPEPQRSQLEKIVLKQVFSLDRTCVILQGLPGSARRVDLTSTATMYSHLDAKELRNLLNVSEYVICRAGYTGIMDLALLNKKAMIIPTPGQTEQEYLAGYLAGKGLFLICRQNELDLQSALKDLADFEPVFDIPAGDFLGDEIGKYF